MKVNKPSGDSDQNPDNLEASSAKKQRISRGLAVAVFDLLSAKIDPKGHESSDSESLESVGDDEMLGLDIDNCGLYRGVQIPHASGDKGDIEIHQNDEEPDAEPDAELDAEPDAELDQIDSLML